MSAVEHELRLEIDRLRLDEEWCGHPRMANYWRGQKAEAIRAVSEVKAKRDVTAAELRKEMRANPEAYNLRDKPTVDALADELAISPAYQKALKDVRAAEYHLGIIEAACESLVDRKHALQKMVDLLQEDYFAAPHANGAARETTDGYERRAARGRGVRPRSENGHAE